MSKELSLVIPVFNEQDTIAELILSIRKQEYQPDEVIFVDGGSTDQTVKLIRELTIGEYRYRLIEAGRAMPGKGRNIGTFNAANEWIVYTDAGIQLHPAWLKELVVVRDRENADLVFGNYSPKITSFFELAATLAYVPPLHAGVIRSDSIASCLLHKSIWQKAGGFPDWRATEDLVFIQEARKNAAQIADAPSAMVFWQLRPGFNSTYRKFRLYSMYNVWAERQAFWHYGMARQYLLMLPFLALAIFNHPLWLLMFPAWFGARAFRRAWMHRFEFGTRKILNPMLLFMVALITLTIDIATYSGWLGALLNKKGARKFSSSE